MKILVVAFILVTTSLLPRLADAQEFVNTGIPTGTGAPVNLLNGTSFAVEFNINAGQTVSSISTYLAAITGDAGIPTSYNLTIYSTLARNLPPASFSAAMLTTGTTGWSTDSNVNWTPTSSGPYWLVVTGTSMQSMDLPPLTTTTTGPTPAVAFDTKSGSNWVAGPSFGVQIEGVPEPSSWMLGLGCMGIFSLLCRHLRSQLN